MKITLFLVALCAIGFSAAVHAEDAKPDADGFISMFNGNDLTGWDGLEGFWSVKDGAIVGAETKEHAAPQTFLTYKDQFADFELHYSYKFATPDGNSGVQIRSKMLDEKTHRIGGYQADCDAKRGYDGSIYDEAGVAGKRNTMSNRGEKTTWDTDNKRNSEKLPETNAQLKEFVKLGDWNEVVVVAKGNHITYTINGHLMTDLTDDSPKAVASGLIGLQLHAGFTMEIQFKDLKIKDLGATK
jgi:hypothetical protein